MHVPGCDNELGSFLKKPEEIMLFSLPLDMWAFSNPGSGTSGGTECLRPRAPQ